MVMDTNKLKIFIKIFYQISIHKNNKKLFTTKDNSPRSGGGLPIDSNPLNADQGSMMGWESKGLIFLFGNVFVNNVKY